MRGQLFCKPPVYAVSMNTRSYLAVCLSLIAGSVFPAPETTWLGMSPTLALDLSRALLVLGIIAAVLTVNAEARALGSGGE
jgi:hypothetical protein